MHKTLGLFNEYLGVLTVKFYGQYFSLFIEFATLFLGLYFVGAEEKS